MADDENAQERLIANEQVKLTANLFNSIASGSLLAGAIGPIVSGLYTQLLPNSPFWSAYALFWTIVATAAHLFARGYLKGLR